MPDVENPTVWTIPAENDDEPARQYVLTIDVDPATGKPVVGARDVTYDDEFQSSIDTVPPDDESGPFSLTETPTTADPNAESNSITNPEGNE